MSETKIDRKPLGKDASTRRRTSTANRHFRLRKKVAGTAERPRLAVKRSSRHIHVQLIDDLAGKIRSGGSGVWGPVPMPAQTLPEADARTLAQWLKDGAKK